MCHVLFQVLQTRRQCMRETKSFCSHGACILRWEDSQRKIGIQQSKTWDQNNSLEKVTLELDLKEQTQGIYFQNLKQMYYVPDYGVEEFFRELNLYSKAPPPEMFVSFGLEWSPQIYILLSFQEILCKIPRYRILSSILIALFQCPQIKFIRVINKSEIMTGISAIDLLFVLY